MRFTSEQYSTAHRKPIFILVHARWGTLPVTGLSGSARVGTRSTANLVSSNRERAGVLPGSLPGRHGAPAAMGWLLALLLLGERSQKRRGNTHSACCRGGGWSSGHADGCRRAARRTCAALHAARPCGPRPRCLPAPGASGMACKEARGAGPTAEQRRRRRGRNASSWDPPPSCAAQLLALCSRRPGQHHNMMSARKAHTHTYTSWRPAGGCSRRGRTGHARPLAPARSPAAPRLPAAAPPRRPPPSARAPPPAALTRAAPLPCTPVPVPQRARCPRARGARPPSSRL
jgi:hypothetical protein